ncbi:hypothetical protein C0989_002444 [Termitomyces sp. Mn162]|nr:hypothetical protein C0989_002444 [Termitomyces sp. Mn162]
MPNWAQGKVTMSWCPQRCSACATKAQEDHKAEGQEHTAIQACCTSNLPFVDLDLLDLPPLAFSHREALYKDDQSSGRAPEEELEEEFGGIHNSELLDEAVEVGDWIYTITLCSPPYIVEIWASQTTSQQLAQVFAANSMLWALQDVVPPYLHIFKNVFSKASFDLLLEHKKWDYAIELMPNSKPSSCKVYPLVPKEQDELDAFLQ